MMMMKLLLLLIVVTCLNVVCGHQKLKLDEEDVNVWKTKGDFEEVLREDDVLRGHKEEMRIESRKIALPLLRRILMQGDTLRPQKLAELNKKIDKNKLTCKACGAAVAAIQTIQKLNVVTQSEIVVIATEICKLANIEDDRVCELAVKQFTNEVLYVVFNLKPNELCYWLLKDKCKKPDNFMPEWEVKIAPPRPLPARNTTKESGVLKALYFTDIHVDFQYGVGSTATCGEPLCCRVSDGRPANATDGAWRFGDYRNCDMPHWTFESMLKLHSEKDIDFILFTGDIPAHDVWNQSNADQVDKINRFTQMLLKYFPKTPVYAAMGNHESSPVNSYPPPQVADEPGGNIQWLFDAYARNWGNWLPSDALVNVKKGGFYTTLIKPGFRVVSLNDNFGSDDDWWLMVSDYSVDPHGQVQWFSDTMDMAERNHEMVLLITHRPTGGLLTSWQRNYYNIINRYKNNIVAQLFGHAHSDELRLYYDINNSSHVTSVAFIGPGFTTYSELNTGHRIYEFNDTSFEILDATTYYMDIQKVNSAGEPVWEREYSFKKDYGMTSLNPQDWGKLVDRFGTDDDLFQAYKRHVSKSKDESNCSGDCKHDTICSIKNNVQDLNVPC